MDEHLSDYERKRMANIAEREAFLASILPKIKAIKAVLPADLCEKEMQQRPMRKAVRRLPAAKNRGSVLRRSRRIEQKVSKTKLVKGFKGFREVDVESGNVDGDTCTAVEYVCDSDDSDDDDDDDDWDKYEKIEFYVPTADSTTESDSDEGGIVQRKRKPSHRQIIIPELKPEDVTDNMIQNISYNSGCKEYDSQSGTCCHQCRQKTKDTKSVCRSGVCSGVRGQFCGPCLLNRYGEKVSIVLKDPDWKCPPCRGICNCSICRTRLGKLPTGILVPYVKEKGYESVSDFLQESERKEEKPKAKFDRKWKIKLFAHRDYLASA